MARKSEIPRQYRRHWDANPNRRQQCLKEHENYVNIADFMMYMNSKGYEKSGMEAPVQLSSPCQDCETVRLTETTPLLISPAVLQKYYHLSIGSRYVGRVAWNKEID